MTAQVLVDWFDAVEAVLVSEARVAGLLDHAATIGQAREFVVTRMLRAILPAGVHIGTGKVIDSDGKSSRQIDIIIYDPRFPMLKLEGGGFYFVEGVLATIEIKSTINTAELKGALENCRSVLELRFNGEHREEADARTKVLATLGGITDTEARDRLHYRLQPATYVFAFNSALTFDTVVTAIGDWWTSINCRNSAYWPFLPRVIVAGETVGVVNDGRIDLNAADGKRHVMGIFHTPHRFRWLAIHLMDTVNQRLGVRNFGEGFNYQISNYYPLDHFVAQIDAAQTKFIDRTITTP